MGDALPAYYLKKKITNDTSFVTQIPTTRGSSKIEVKCVLHPKTHFQPFGDLENPKK